MTMDWSPIGISMKTASLSILVTFFLGLIVAWFLVKIKNDTAKIILDGIFTLPLVLPPTVVGFFLLYVFGVRGPIGKFFIEFFAVKIAFSWWATVIAAVVMSFPLMYRSARGAFEQVDSNLLDAGRTLGMSEWKIFWKVLFANALPGATAMLAGNIAGQTRTLPMAVYSEVAAGNMGEASYYVIVIIVIAFIAIFIMDFISIRKEKQWK
ncbi:molybdenum ABC transporter permease [uncultured Methanobrevibacter sp.]|uniref:molybdate ABC transporter permease subunit n=1 Tax=uncultured Methanobrevibacter sp. TaxID=253161 RepID=UPI0025DC7F3A|nr:molybdenum ABC transporter permease [uncultured Methanobrevibacter sp.]